MNLQGIGAVTGATSGVLGSIGNIATGILNYNQQKDLMNYNKQLQREIFQREDTAIQRRAADIKKAGGNPALAWESGNGAGAGQSLSLQAPQVSPENFATLAHSSASFFDLDRIINENRMNDVQVKNIQAQTDKTYAETATAYINQLYLKEQTAKSKEEKNLIQQEIRKLKHDLDMSITQGLRSIDTKGYVLNSADALINRTLSRFNQLNIDTVDDNALYKTLLDIGLFAIPGFGVFKAYKGVKNAWKLRKAGEYIKVFGVPKTKKDFSIMYKFLRNKDNKVYDYKPSYYK